MSDPASESSSDPSPAPAPAPPPAARPRRNWFRYSLRTLLLGAPLVAILISVVGVRWYQSYVESQAVRAIQKLGGTIQRNAEGRIVLVEVPGAELDAQALKELVPHLANLPTLETLILHGPFLTGEGLGPLSQLTQIKRLHLINMQTTPEAIAALKKGRPGMEIDQSATSPTASALAARNIFDHALLRVAFAPSQHVLVTGRADGRLEFWEIDSGQIVWSTKAHDEWLFGLALSPGGKLLATAGGDNVIRLWDLARRKCVGELAGHGDDVHAVAFTPDGARLVTSSDDWTLRIWDVASKTTLHVLAGHEGTIPGLAISPDGRTIASASRDDTIRLWDCESGKPLAVLRGHTHDVMSVAFSPDGAKLASASYDKTVRIWDVATGAAIATLRGPQEWAFAVRFSPDGRRIAAGSGDGIRVWDVTGGNLLFAARDVRLISSLAFDSSGDRLAATSAEGTIHLWNARSWTPLATYGQGYREPEERSLAAAAGR
jgi:dipeptidyl aminopeptidase/acylaminoacyl peptidase